MEIDELDIPTIRSRGKAEPNEQSAVIIERIHVLILKMQVQMQERIDELWVLENHAKVRTDKFIAEQQKIQDKTLKELMDVHERTEELQVEIQERTEAILTEIQPHLADVSAIKEFLLKEVTETREMQRQFLRNLSKQTQDIYYGIARWAIIISIGAVLSFFTLEWVIKKINGFILLLFKYS